MRDLTKSMMSFSWAMSLFGLRQMTCMLMPQSWGSTASSFETVTRCTEDQLGSTTQSFFRAGDNLQRGLVDLMFGLFTFGALGPERGRGDDRGRGRRADGSCDVLRSSVEWGADVMERSARAGADVVRQTVGGAGTGAPSTAQGDAGWGPMPGGR